MKTLIAIMVAAFLASALAPLPAVAQSTAPKRGFADLPLPVQLVIAWPWVLARLGVFWPAACDSVGGTWTAGNDCEAGR